MNYYDQLIDLALETRDFEWVKELVKLKEESVVVISPTKDVDVYSKSKALEDLNDKYVIKNEYGLRNIIHTSEDDILKSNIVELKNFEYKDGIYCKQNNEVEYYQYDVGSEYLLKYYLLGYSNGIRHGNELNGINKLVSKNDIEIVNIINKYGLKND